MSQIYHNAVGAWAEGPEFVSMMAGTNDLSQIAEGVYGPEYVLSLYERLFVERERERERRG